MAEQLPRQFCLMASYNQWMNENIYTAAAKLTDAQREDLSNKHHLTAPDAVQLSTPEQLQDALDDCDLDHWVSRTQALPNRFEAARHAAVQLLKPNVIRVDLPKRTLNDEVELKAWLSQVETLLSDKLKHGPVSL